MTTSRRPVGRGRPLAVAAALVMLVASPLPWYTFEGDLPGLAFRAWDGSGVLVVAAGLAVLALVTLPWAAAEAPDVAARVDRWPAYTLAAGVAALGLVAWPISFLDAPVGLRPDRAPGLWMAVIGVVLLVVAARLIAREALRRNEVQ